jgi:superfamily II DNA/RNA helicase
MLSQDKHLLSLQNSTMSLPEKNEWDDETEKKDEWEDETETKDDKGDNEDVDIDNENNILMFKKFEDMEINETVLRGIFNAGFVSPAPFQRTIIPTCIANKDKHVVVEAATGSGKTLCFLIVAANSIKPTIKRTQVLVLSPVRELAYQIYDEALKLFKDSPISVAFHRGTTAGKQGVKSVGDKYMTTNMDHFGHEHIVISTPQRCLALFTEPTFVMQPNRKIHLNPQFIQEVVIDECDKILSTSERHSDMAYQVHEILALMPNARQSLYSATMSENTKLHGNELDAMYLKFVANEKIGNTVDHYWVGLQDERDKYACLENILRGINNAGSVFVFASSILSAEEICRFLTDEKCSVDFIHGSLPQTMRDSAIKNFREGKTRILVSTELAARGIDINSVDLVFNFDLPSTGTDYMHRSGRAGRFGKRGIAISFVLPLGNARPADIIRIEKENNIQIEHLPPLESLKL